MRHAITVIIGLCVGYLFSNIPALAEWALQFPMCRESCPGWFTATFIGVYFTMPLGWAALFTIAIGKSRGPRSAKGILIPAAFISAALMSAIAFFAYAHQVRLL